MHSMVRRRRAGSWERQRQRPKKKRGSKGRPKFIFPPYSNSYSKAQKGARAPKFVISPPVSLPCAVKKCHIFWLFCQGLRAA